MSDTPKEFRKESVHKIAYNILKNSEKPMKVKEIVKQVLEKKQLHTKTPTNTISAILQRSEYFVKVDRATYTIKK